MLIMSTQKWPIGPYTISVFQIWPQDKKYVRIGPCINQVQLQRPSLLQRPTPSQHRRQNADVTCTEGPKSVYHQSVHGPIHA